MPIYNEDYFDRGPMPTGALHSSIGIGPKVTKLIDKATKEWLDEHPEATSSVPDLSIDTRKLADGAVTIDKLSPSVIFDLNNKKLFVFDTVEDMKASDLLYVGAICHTNGFHSAGDGGAAWYKVSDSGTTNEMDVIALQDELIATLVITNDLVATPEMFGAWGDGSHDDTDSIQRCFNSCDIVNANNYYTTDCNITIDKPRNSFTLIGGTYKLESVSYTGTTNHFIFDNINNLIIINTSFDGGNIVPISNQIINEVCIGENINNASIKNCEMKNACGSALYTSKNLSNPTNCIVENCNIHHNAIHGIASNITGCITIDNCMLNDNYGQGFDIVVYGEKYPDVILLGLRPTAIIRNCSILRNGSGSNELGQPYAYGAKIYSHSLAIIENCVFQNNGNATYTGQQLRIGNYNHYSNEAGLANGYISIKNCQFILDDNFQYTQQIRAPEQCERLEIDCCCFETFCNFNITNDAHLAFASPVVFTNNILKSDDTSHGHVIFWHKNTTISKNIILGVSTVSSVVLRTDTTVVGSDVKNCYVKDNYIEDNTTGSTASILIRNCKNVHVSGNTCRSITLFDGSDNVVLDNNLTGGNLLNTSTNLKIPIALNLNTSRMNGLTNTGATINANNLIFNSSDHKFYYWDSGTSAWVAL